jgi:hypothetical protein
VSAESGPSNPPLEPTAAAVELLLTRAESLSLDAHVKPLRYLYQLAVYDDDDDGPLVDDLSSRYPCGRAKSPTIEVGWLKSAIRAELGLRVNQHITASTVQEWVRERNRAVRRGARPATFSDAELTVLAPSWAVEVLAACLPVGPTKIRARVEAWGTDYANGKLGVRSTKSGVEHSRTVPAPRTVDGVRESLGALFKLGMKALREKHSANPPDWLLPWPGYWSNLAISANEWATGRRRARVTESVMRDAFLWADEVCAAPFIARFGMTDIELVRDHPEIFLPSFPDHGSARAWLYNKNIEGIVRGRGLGLTTLVAGERAPQLTNALREHLVMPPFEHSGLTPEYGVHRTYGAILFGRSAKTQGSGGAHFQPLPLEVWDRLRVLMFFDDVLAGGTLSRSTPLFLSTVKRNGELVGLSQRALGAAAVAVLAHRGALPKHVDRRTFNILRRYTARSAMMHFKEYRDRTDGVLPGITSGTVKEIILGHARIAADEHTYAGLSDDDGRVVVSSYGAEIVIGTIFGTLGRRRGPDRGRVEDALARQRAVEQRIGILEAELDRLGGRLLDSRARRANGFLDEDIVRFVVLSNEQRKLAGHGVEQKQRVTDLLTDEEHWVDLPDGVRRLTKRDLPELGASLLSVGDGIAPPVRDFLTIAELARLLGVDIGSLRLWIQNPERRSRKCPWVGPAPFHRPNERTVLIAAAALDPRRVEPDRWTAIRRTLSVWPYGQGWDRPRGAKTKTVEALSTRPVELGRSAANELLSEPVDSCVAIFRFDVNVLAA